MAFSSPFSSLRHSGQASKRAPARLSGQARSRAPAHRTRWLRATRRHPSEARHRPLGNQSLPRFGSARQASPEADRTEHRRRACSLADRRDTNRSRANKRRSSHATCEPLHPRHNKGVDNRSLWESCGPEEALPRDDSWRSTIRSQQPVHRKLSKLALAIAHRHYVRFRPAPTRNTLAQRFLQQSDHGRSVQRAIGSHHTANRSPMKIVGTPPQTTRQPRIKRLGSSFSSTQERLQTLLEKVGPTSNPILDQTGIGPELRTTRDATV